MAIKLMVTCKSSVDRFVRPQIVCGTLRKPQLVVDGGWQMADGGSSVASAVVAGDKCRDCFVVSRLFA